MAAPSQKPKADAQADNQPATEDDIAYLAKRHRVSPAIVREIIRASGANTRGAIEREIARGKARR